MRAHPFVVFVRSLWEFVGSVGGVGGVPRGCLWGPLGVFVGSLGFSNWHEASETNGDGLPGVTPGVKLNSETVHCIIHAGMGGVLAALRDRVDTPGVKIKKCNCPSHKCVTGRAEF